MIVDTMSSFGLTGVDMPPASVRDAKRFKRGACKKSREPRRTRRHNLTAVDLYSGCGGVTAGLKKRGYSVVAAVDNDPMACATYRANHPEVNLYDKDIRSIDPEEILRNDLAGRQLDLLVVCAPCQPFSSLNRKSKEDPRAQLILQASRFVGTLKPSVVFFENVPGLASRDASPILGNLRKELSAVGYLLGDPVRVDAADYGVPQRRVRCIMFAVPQETPLPTLPQPTTPEGRRNTVRKAIGKLRSLRSGERDRRDSLHFARTHHPVALARLSFIPKNGGNRFSLPAELELVCHRGRRGHPDVYGRMMWDNVAPTLTTGCTDVTKGRFAHPRDNRAISLREAALLQTFPKRYKFVGFPRNIAKQIGNAVPVRFVATLASVLREVMKPTSKS